MYPTPYHNESSLVEYSTYLNNQISKTYVYIPVYSTGIETISISRVS